MTRFDSDVELTLELARSAREPSAADKQRVLKALRARLTPMPADPSIGQSPAGASALAPLAKPVIYSALIAALAGAAGFWLGTSAGSPWRERDGATLEAAPASELARAPAAQVVQQSPVAAVPVPPPAPPALPPSLSSEPPASKAKRDLDARKDTSFADVVRLLARAQRALERGEPPLALALLDEIDAKFPAHILDEERHATRAIAWCKSGDKARAAEAAEALRARKAASVYAARIERSCSEAALGRSP